MVDCTIQSGNFSRASSVKLIAVAAKPAGHRNIGQVSPTRRVSDFQRKYKNGTITAVDNRIATGSRVRAPRHAVSVTPESTTGSSTKPTRPNCRLKNSPSVRSDSGCSATARTSWKRNEAQSC